MRFKSPWNKTRNDVMIKKGIITKQGMISKEIMTNVTSTTQCFPRAMYNPNENKSAENPYRPDMGQYLYAPNGISYEIPRFLHGIVNRGQGDSEINEYILYSTEASELCLSKDDYFRVKDFQVKINDKIYKMKDMIGLDKQFVNTLNGNNNFVTKEFLDLFFKNQNVTISHTVDPKFIQFYPGIPNVIQQINGIQVQIPYQISVSNGPIPYLAFQNENIITPSSSLFYNLSLFLYDYYGYLVQIQPLQFTNLHDQSLEGLPISPLLLKQMMESIQIPLLKEYDAVKLQVKTSSTSTEPVYEYEQVLQTGQVAFYHNEQPQGYVSVGLNNDGSIYTTSQSEIPTYLQTISNTGTIIDHVLSSSILYFNNQPVSPNQKFDLEILKQLLVFAQKSYQGTNPNVKFAFIDVNGKTIVETNIQ